MFVELALDNSPGEELEEVQELWGEEVVEALVHIAAAEACSSAKTFLASTPMVVLFNKCHNLKTIK